MYKIKKFKTKEEWLKAREGILTGTKMSIILGLNPWTKFKDLNKDDDFKGNSYSDAGTILEPAVVNVTNHVLKDEEFELMGTKTYPYILCINEEINLASTPDAITVDGLKVLEKKNVKDIKELSLLECKTKNSNIDKWKVSPPIEYICQQYTQILSTGIDRNVITGASTDFTQKKADSFQFKGYIYELYRDSHIDDMICTQLERYQNNKDAYKPCFFSSKMIQLKLIQSMKRLYPK